MNLLCLLIIRPEIAFMCVCVYIYIYICSKITLLFCEQYGTGTGAELQNILGYQMAHILTLVLKSNFLLLLLYLGCATDQRSIPLGYLHLLGQDHSILVSVLWSCNN
jgi:hypothetical protein